MATLTRYYPFITGISRQETAKIESLDDLYLVPWLARLIQEPGFVRLSVSRAGSENLLMAELDSCTRNRIVGHLDTPVSGLSDWEPRRWWTTLVPGTLPAKYLIIRATGFDCRKVAEDVEWRPLERMAVADAEMSVWDSVAHATNRGGYVGVVAKQHEITLRARDAEAHFPTELGRTTAFLVHFQNSWWPFRWTAYSRDEDSGETSQSISGDERQLGTSLHCC